MSICRGKCDCQNRLRCGTIKDFPEIQISDTFSLGSSACTFHFCLALAGPTPLGRPMFPKLQTPSSPFNLATTTDDQRSNFASPQLTTSARKAITYSHIFDADNPHTGSPGYGIWDRHSWRPPTTMPQSVRDLCYAAISPSFGFHVQPSVPLSLTLSNGIHSFLHHSSCVAELLTANGVTLLSLVYHWCPAID